MVLDSRALESSLQTASAEIANSRNRLHADIPDILFHYTTSTGMRGIIESSRLWATNYRFLNDVSEIAYGMNLFESLIQERLTRGTNDVTSEFLARTLHTANAFDGMFDCYIACFCERDDLLSQWRTYAESGGGYALGLNAGHIGRRLGQFERDQDFELRRVIYDVDVQRNLLSEVIDKAIEVLVNGAHGASVEEANNIIAQCCHFVRVEIASYLLSFKHPAFAIEKEWRLCHIVSPREDDHVLFRDGQFGLTPYVCLDISPIGGINHNRLPLVRITHGPVPNPEHVRFALSKLISSKGYMVVEIAGATLPIRF